MLSVYIPAFDPIVAANPVFNEYPAPGSAAIYSFPFSLLTVSEEVKSILKSIFKMSKTSRCSER
jgi:hypothetical protein